MPFRASAPFLRFVKMIFLLQLLMYQCPFGLVLHFYKVKCALLRMTFRYQCPFGLVLHFYRKGLIMLNITVERVSMPSRAGTPFLRLDKGYYRQDEVAVSMPSRAGTPFLQNAWVVEMIEDGRSINALSGWYSISTGKQIISQASVCQNVSMPSRAGTPFLRYPFKNLGFMRFLEPVFAGIYQNILTMTIFRAC